jgi:hypothetical protein
MHLGTRHRPLSRLATRLVLLLALVAASITLTHCRNVGDRLTGVDVGLFARKNQCLADCQAQFQARNQAEDQLHEQNLAACGSNQACRDAENARHDAAEAASKAQRDACMNACHQQGGGNAGP